MWLAVSLAIFASVCYGFMAIQSKFVSNEYQRLSLAHLNVHAQFLYGMFLMPFFFYEVAQDDPAFSMNDVLMTILGAAINSLACIAIAYAFKHGIAGRVQSIAAAQVFVVLILARSFGKEAPNWLEFLGGLGVAVGVVGVLSLWRVK